MKKLIFVLIGMTLLLIVSTSYAFLIRYDGPYEGRIVDADTGNPIEGVVVLGVWYNEEPNVAGSTSTYYDASETVTDENGEFSISGKGLQIFSHVGYMNFLIFKAGYQYESGPWPSLKVGLIYRDTIKWDGEKPIIPLKKLTMEERKKQGSPDYPSEAHRERIKLMLKEINKDRTERGLKSVD